MSTRDYRSFSQLDDSAREELFQHVCAQYFDEDRNIAVIGETIDGHMNVLTVLFRLRDLFASLPRLQILLGDMRGLEWGGAGRRKGAKEIGKIPAVPDAVFSPLMAEALCWVDHYSSDVIELMKIEREAAARCAHWHSNSRTSYINRHLVGFKFSKSPLTNRRWRRDLVDFEEVEEVDEEGRRMQRIGPLTVLRGLASDLLAASSVVIQGFTGMRVSELLGLRSSIGASSDLPSCVSIRQSMDGVNDVFHINGQIFKGHDTDNDRDGQWVVGIRPGGTSYIPEVVRAVRIILTLVEGWRDSTEESSVFIYPNTKGMPRSKSSVGPLTSNTLRKLQQQFLCRYVTLPVEVSGWELSTHQFRKKFAQDIVRCDPDALPAIREHFKHMSMHILETGYIGHDTEMLKLIDEVALRDAAAQIMSILDGEPVAGKMADEIRKASVHLKKITDRCDDEEAKRRKIEAAIASESVRAWPCDFGTCLFRAETAMCHFAGKGNYDPSAIKPLPSERCADRCCTCSNLVVSARNVPYWKDRYLYNERLRLTYKNEGNTAWALLASRRAKVASTILKSHNVSTEGLAHAC